MLQVQGYFYCTKTNADGQKVAFLAPAYAEQGRHAITGTELDVETLRKAVVDLEQLQGSEAFGSRAGTAKGKLEELKWNEFHLAHSRLGILAEEKTSGTWRPELHCGFCAKHYKATRDYKAIRERLQAE